MKPVALKLLPLICAMSLIPACSYASDADGEFHGYFRIGIGSSSSSRGPQACYGLGGNTQRYRLGNECDAYGELEYQKEMVKSKGGVSFVGHAMLAVYKPMSDVGGAGDPPEFSKMYVEVKNMPELNGGTAWIGKRYYMRPDAHMLDFQYINMNGTGGGIDQYQIGPGKLSYAIFKDKDTLTKGAATSAIRQNLVYQGIPVNPDGTLDIMSTFITPDAKNPAAGVKNHSGWQLTLLHKQDKVFGGGNTIALQHGVGPGAASGCCNRMGATGNLANGSDVKRTRLLDSLWTQFTPDWSMELAAVWQRDRSDASGSSTWTSFGVRPVYALSEHFKLQAEIGTDRVTVPGGDSKRLTKITFAPTLTAGRGYWERPELRAFVTYAKWNDAATASVNAANEAGKVFGLATSGTSFGLQVETWF